MLSVAGEGRCARSTSPDIFPLVLLVLLVFIWIYVCSSGLWFSFGLMGFLWVDVPPLGLCNSRDLSGFVIRLYVMPKADVHCTLGQMGVVVGKSDSHPHNQTGWQGMPVRDIPRHIDN